MSKEQRREEAKARAQFIAREIRNIAGQKLPKIISDYKALLDFSQHEHLMISQGAWNYIDQARIDPKLVFAHPDMLHEQPQASQYYRSLALLPLKRVSELVTEVGQWELGTRSKAPDPAVCLQLSQLYNAIISSIIEDSTDWTLENGYKNITATLAIKLDGQYRNMIGQNAEQLIRERLLKWLQENKLLIKEISDTQFELPQGTFMQFGSEPDIAFTRNGTAIAVMEIKGGRDPAGALERLGAMKKSFDAAPPSCHKFLIAGVITDEMQARLDAMGMIKVYVMSNIVAGGQGWDEFVQELFHHAIRIC